MSQKLMVRPSALLRNAPENDFYEGCTRTGKFAPCPGTPYLVRYAPLGSGVVNLAEALHACSFPTRYTASYGRGIPVLASTAPITWCGSRVRTAQSRFAYSKAAKNTWFASELLMADALLYHWF